jgi:hypothetical protein
MESITVSPKESSRFVPSVSPFVLSPLISSLSVDCLSNSVPPDVLEKSTPGPVDDEGLSFYLVDGHESPETTIVALVPVVPHNKKGPLWHSDGPKIGPTPYVSTRIAVIGIIAASIAIEFVVDENLLPFDENGVAFHADDPFNEIFALVNGIDKDDNIFLLRFVEDKEFVVGKGHRYSIDEFVYEKVVADEEGRLHGARRDLKSLHDKGAYE